MTKSSIFLSLGFASIIGFCLLFASNKVEVSTGIKYDGCYHIYESNNMPSEAFVSFMQECMSK